MVMKQGDYVISAELFREDKGYCLMLEVEDRITEEVSITRWHGNLTMGDIDVAALRNSEIKVFTYNREANIVLMTFCNGYQTTALRACSPRLEDLKFS